MATSPEALNRGGAVAHTRTGWNPREDRIASAVWLGIIWVGVIGGFGLDLRRYFQENPPAHLAVHVHAVVFVVWMVLLSLQVLLVLRGRVSLHRKLGLMVAGWAGLMVVLAVSAVVAAFEVNIHQPGIPTAPPFLSVNINALSFFVIALVWAILQRRNPAVHRRLMILSTVAICDPGFARLGRYLHFTPLPGTPLTFFVAFFFGSTLLYVLMAAWDGFQGRVVRPFLLTGAAMVVGEALASWLFFWQPWRSLTTGWVEAWARIAS
jgi:hypothetical protein